MQTVGPELLVTPCAGDADAENARDIICIICKQLSASRTKLATVLPVFPFNSQFFLLISDNKNMAQL